MLCSSASFARHAGLVVGHPHGNGLVTWVDGAATVCTRDTEQGGVTGVIEIDAVRSLVALLLVGRAVATARDTDVEFRQLGR